MKRRSFLGASAGVAVSAAALGGCAQKAPESKEPLSVLNDDGTLAEKTLQEIHDQYHYDLFDEYIPFHDKYVVDHEYGGFTLTTGWNGPTMSFNKSTWYEGRGIWTYSFMYNEVDKNPKHLEAAKKSVEFILQHMPSGENMFPSSFTREGKVLKGPDNRIYGDIFIANGLCQFSKAVEDERYWYYAKELMLKCLKIYDTAGYFPDAARTYLGTDAPLLPEGARIMGHWFVLLHLATQMLEIRPDPHVEEVAGRCVDAIMIYHYNADYDLFNEVINHDFTMPDNEINQLVYTGHAIETLWMVLYEALRLKDKELFNLTAERLKRHLEVAWDDVYGGVFRNLRHVDNNVWDVDKAGWVQMEALIGLMCIIEHTGAQWAKDYFGKLYTYVIAKFPLKQYGYPLWLDYADRFVTFKGGEGGRRAENFHHPRHLMLNLLAVDRMIKRGGKVSGIFDRA